MTTLKRGSRGDEVRQLQTRLNLQVDGIFGKLTEEAVKEFQKTHGLDADGTVGEQTWAMLGKTKTKKRKVTEIIVHCTATPEGEDYTLEQIRQWHLQRGFTDVGYHYVVYRDGSVHAGRPEAIAGAHCSGHNTRSIGVCYVGGCPARSERNWAALAKDTRTPKQKAALERLLKGLKQKYTHAGIYGHRDFANKLCPSFDAKTEYSTL